MGGTAPDIPLCLVPAGVVLARPWPVWLVPTCCSLCPRGEETDSAVSLLGSILMAHMGLTRPELLACAAPVVVVVARPPRTPSVTT